MDYSKPTTGLVLESERTNRGSEPTGEAVSLSSKPELLRRMGDRVMSTRTTTNSGSSSTNTRSKDIPKSSSSIGIPSKSTLSSSSSSSVGNMNIISYIPKSKETITLWEQCLTIHHKLLGDIPHDYLSGAAEEVIVVLRDNELREQVKRVKVTDLLGKINDDIYTKLVHIAKNLQDFTSFEYGSNSSKPVSGNTAREENDEVAVIYEDDDGTGGQYTNTITDENEEDDDNEAGNNGKLDGDDSLLVTNGTFTGTSNVSSYSRTNLGDSMDTGETGTILSSSSSSSSNKPSRLTTVRSTENVTTTGIGNDYDTMDRQAGLIPVREIDAYWLQAQISKYYDDVNVSQQVTFDVLQALSECISPSSPADVRALENQLVTLLDFNKFDLIRLIIQNANRIYYITRYRQAQNDNERMQIRTQMQLDLTHQGPDLLLRLDESLNLSSETWGTQSREGKIAQRLKQEALELAQRMNQQRNVSSTATGITDMMTKTSKMEMDTDDTDTIFTSTASATSTSSRGRGTTSVSHSKQDNNTVNTTLTDPSIPLPRSQIDLESLAFGAGGHLLTNKKVTLPDKSWRAQKKGYEEVHVPAPMPRPLGPNEKEIKIHSMPGWAQAAFNGMEKLNRVQSKLYEIALFSGENMLLCAPTGAGKTNVAVLSILHELGMHRNEQTNEIDLNAFKIIYVAPMKALVQEVVANFTKRLGEPYGLKVRELSGDQSLTKAEISETQIIVTTPEKWDVITRKSGERTYTQLVRLIIIDEIHLLHDDRGPVLEALVARTLRQVEVSNEMVRIVGLSATLPNFEDVAAFLRVKPDRGLFTFDSSFRPAPLQQQYIGVTEKKPLKRLQLMNEICYEKVLEQAGKNQTLIFVHSRKETARTARALKDMFEASQTTTKLIPEGSASREILLQEAEKTVRDADLKELLPYGFGIHHAGMSRTDRSLVEDLFADNHLQVLISTATLAWGVNLPAHTVIIKGTQIYSPEKGQWTELSPLDVMQMLGRAGRPQYDTFGEGIILTTHTELQYYLSLMNQQLPIESQFIAHLADNLNAEIVLGTIGNIKDAAHWLSYTYLYVRMLRSPHLYGVPVKPNMTNPLADDPVLLQRRIDIIHAAATLLNRHNLIYYDEISGTFSPTVLGRVASYYYLTHGTMATFNTFLKPTLTDLELFRVFSLSSEFRNIVIRQEEKDELRKLMERVPIPIKETMEEPSAKVNLLLQAYISKLKLEGFALGADMVYIHQSAARLMRAIFEICLRRNWSMLARRALDICKMIDRRQWLSSIPLRQFPLAVGGMPEDILYKLERKDVPWERYVDLNANDLGELIRNPKLGKPLYRLVQSLPKVELSANLLPLTRSSLRVELIITPDFAYDIKIHGPSESFWIFVEDTDGETLIHQELFILKNRYATDEHRLSFVLPLTDPLPPQYFIRVLSDRWLQSERLLPLSFRNLILPEKFMPPTELLDLSPLPVTAFKTQEYSNLYNGPYSVLRTPITQFNPIQTQTFHALFETDHNVLIAAPSGAGKTICAEFALLRLFRQNPDARVVYLDPHPSVVRQIFEQWEHRFGQGLEKAVVELTGELTSDVKLVERAHIVCGTPRQWDAISRRWKKRRAVMDVNLYVCDDLDQLGAEVGMNGTQSSSSTGGLIGSTDGAGSVYEIVVSRIRLMALQLEKLIRIVALGNPMANARDIGDWIGSTPSTTFNFIPKACPLYPNVKMQGFDNPNFAIRLQAMARPAYHACVGSRGGRTVSSTLETLANRSRSLIYVPSRRQAQLTAIDLLSFAKADDKSDIFTRLPSSEMTEMIQHYRFQNSLLKHTLVQGVGYWHEGLTENDRAAVATLFAAGYIGVVVAPAAATWSMNATVWAANTVVIMGTETYDGRSHTYVDLPLADILHMMGRAIRPYSDEQQTLGRAIVLASTNRREYLRKFLYEPLPIESCLHTNLHDTMNAEVVNQIIETKQDALDYLTWTLLYRRLNQNPNYYGLLGISHRHLSDYLSDLVDSTLNDLQGSQCISVNDEENTLAPLNLGIIAAHYYTQYKTLEIFASSVSMKTKLRGLVSILPLANEYTDVPIRYGEELTLKNLAIHLPIALQAPKEGHEITSLYHDPHIKTNLLLQAYFSRRSIPSDMRLDQASILEISIPLVQSLVDVISSEGWLKPALAAMELSQMLVQGLWADKDPILMQVPHITREIAERCANYQPSDGNANTDEEENQGVQTVFDLMSLDDNVRNELLGLSPDQMMDVAAFCNRYPNINMEYDIVTGETVQAGEDITVVIQLEREANTEGMSEGAGFGAVYAPLFPKPKSEGWWLIIGQPGTNTIAAIKRITLSNSSKVTLSFPPPTGSTGVTPFRLYFMADSYLGCDQEYDFNVTILEGDNGANNVQGMEEDNSI